MEVAWLKLTCVASCNYMQCNARWEWELTSEAAWSFLSGNFNSLSSVRCPRQKASLQQRSRSKKPRTIVLTPADVSFFGSKPIPGERRSFQSRDSCPEARQRQKLTIAFNVAAAIPTFVLFDLSTYLFVLHDCRVRQLQLHLLLRRG